MMSCSNGSDEDNSGGEVAITGNAVPSYTDVVIDGYANLTSVTVDLSKVKMGVELSLVEDFYRSSKEYTRELVGNKLTVEFKYLKPDTKYYYRVFVLAGNVTYYGQTKSFETLFDDRYHSRLHELLIDSNKLVFEANEEKGELTSVFTFDNEDLSNYAAVTDVDWCTVTFDAYVSTMTVSVKENTEEWGRKAYVTLYDVKDGETTRPIVVTQKGLQSNYADKITITNNTSTSFLPLYIRFRNVTGELLNDENLGDLYPGESVSARIPGGAATWFLYTTIGGNTYYTADHLISEITFSIQSTMTWYALNQV